MYETVYKIWEDYVPDFMAEQDLQDEIRKNNWDYSHLGVDAKLITAFRKKAKASRAKEWKLGTMSENFQYYHWDQFVEDEHGAPTLELKKGAVEKGRMEKEPYDLLHEISSLLWIRHEVREEGDHMAPLGHFRPGL